jgi:uncharacterized protein YabN with tetrapyrrole methylase and pyrophosphatase domain
MSEGSTESPSDPHDAGARFQHLVEIMRTLRSEQGCAWDRQQTLKTLRPFVLQETYELLDALDRGDYHSRQQGNPSLTPQEVKQQWEEIKSKERKDAGEHDKTLLSGVPRSMPSLLRAFELSTRAAQVGFDWTTQGDVIDKAEEEIKELREAVAAGGGTSPHAEEEFGDLLFALVNVARKLGIEPEAALRVANDKFQRRFDDVERQVHASGKKFRDLNLEQLEVHWQRAKATTKGTK